MNYESHLKLLGKIDPKERKSSQHAEAKKKKPHKKQQQQQLTYKNTNNKKGEYMIPAHAGRGHESFSKPC